MDSVARIILMKTSPIMPISQVTKARQTSFPPLGLLYIGEILRRAGHAVKILDQDATGYSNQKMFLRIKKFNPDILGVSPLTVTLDSALNIAEMVKGWNENVKTVFGNILATLAPHQLLKYPFIDYCLRGEAEFTFPEFVEILEHGGVPTAVLGCAYRQNGSIRINPLPPLNRNLDLVPIPDRKALLDFNYRLGSHKFTILATSRGCPFRCKFCSVHLVSDSRGIWRRRSIEHVLEELHLLQSQGYQELSFVDDCFTVNPKRTVLLCQRMKKEKIDMVWSCEGRIDQCTKEILRTMRYANCYNLILGIESANQRILDYYNKQITPEMSRKVVQNVKKAGIENLAGLFVVGGPDETVQEILHTLKFGLELDLTFIQYQLLYILLGSELWNESVGKGLINQDRDWNKNIIVADLYPTAVKREKIEAMIDKAFIQFLSRPKYLIKELFRTVKSPYRLQNVYTLLNNKPK